MIYNIYKKTVIILLAYSILSFMIIIRKREISFLNHNCFKRLTFFLSPAVAVQQQSSKTTRLNILSPEKVHRLGARLSDQKQKMREEAAATASSLGGVGAGAGSVASPAAGSLNGHLQGHRTGASGSANPAAGERRRRAAPPPPVRTHFNTRC